MKPTKYIQILILLISTTLNSLAQKTNRISLIGPCLYVVPLNAVYSDPGVIAFDSTNNNITNQVIISGYVNTFISGRYEMNYCVSANAQTACIKRVVLVSDEGLTANNFSLFDSIMIQVNEKKDTINQIINKLKNKYGLQISNSDVVVDSSKVGVYYVQNYILDSLCSELIFSLKVNIADVFPPQIKLKGADTICVPLHGSFYDSMAIATDNYWPAATISIVKKGLVNYNYAGQYYITYTATDPSGNKSSIIRVVKVGDCSIKYDKNAPVISLIGRCLQVITLNTKYVEAGYLAYDSALKDISANVLVSGYVDTSKVSRNELTYCISYAGKTACVKRVVLVSNARIDTSSGIEIVIKKIMMPQFANHDTIGKYITYAFPEYLGVTIPNIPVWNDSLFQNTHTYHFDIVDSICGTIQINMPVFMLIPPGIKVQNDMGSISVYPNPTNDFINIGYSGAYEIKQIQIFDILGNLVKHQEYNSAINSTIQLNLIAIPSGVYFAELSGSFGKLTRKIIINR